MQNIVRRSTAGLGVLLLPLILGGCPAPTHGVDVYNETDQVLRAELITVNPRGESSTYSTAIINRGAIFENRMQEPVFGQTMRVRFSLADQPPDDSNWVMLKLPPDATRTYALRMENGRLHAEEYKGTKPRE